MTRLLRAGDRIRLKVRTMGGWKGEATVVKDQHGQDDPLVYFRRDDRPDWWPPGCALRDEVALVRSSAQGSPRSAPSPAEPGPGA